MFPGRIAGRLQDAVRGGSSCRANGFPLLGDQQLAFAHHMTQHGRNERALVGSRLDVPFRVERVELKEIATLAVYRRRRAQPLSEDTRVAPRDNPPEVEVGEQNRPLWEFLTGDGGPEDESACVRQLQRPTDRL